MPSSKTECTEISFGFGILAVENLLYLDQNQVEQLFEGTLSKRKYDRFKEEFRKNEILYRQMYNVGFGLRATYAPFKKVSSLKWSGPQQQAAMTAAAKDLIADNTPISVKANSDVVHNPSPYNLFETIPSGQVKAHNSKNWYLEQAPKEYQELYSFIRSNSLVNLPVNVSEFEQTIRRGKRKSIKAVIEQFSDDEKMVFKQLYLKLCHQVAEKSADIFNKHYSASMRGHSRNAVLEQITRYFFRMDAVDYILGGIDRNGVFAVIVPDLTRWKSKWKITNVVAEPELDREQSRVRFTVYYTNRINGISNIAEFHTQIRWSHGKFQNNPEAKLYKNFAWENLAFFESIYGHESYTRLKIIGQGSYGIVYEALHHQTAEKVAVKEFQATFATTTEERGRFEREVKIMSELKHPNILPVLDFNLSWQNKNKPWFATPLAVTSVADIVDDLRHDLNRVNSIYIQILTGIAYAHRQNIIHRDLKPQNILLFPDDKVMIGDFGLGKNLGASTSNIALTESDEQLGTFAYMAPEQLTSAALVDHRADIYSLGKTLLHMLVGGDPPIFPEHIIQQVDERYVSFINGCIQEYPENRFKSVDEMIESFKAIASKRCSN